MKKLQKILFAVLMVGVHKNVIGSSDAEYKRNILVAAMNCLPILNAIEYVNLSNIQEKLRRDYVMGIIHSSQDVLHAVQRSIKNEAMSKSEFMSLYITHSPQYHMGNTAGLIARSLFTGFNFTTKNYIGSCINAATSLPRTWHHVSTRLSYNQAKKEADLLTVDNLEKFLITKLNDRLVENMNASSLQDCKEKASYMHEYYYLKRLRSLQPHQDIENRKSKALTSCSTLLGKLNDDRAKKKQKHLPEDILANICGFVGPSSLPTAHRVMTAKEKSHIGELPYEFYQKYPRAVQQANPANIA